MTRKSADDKKEVIPKNENYSVRERWNKKEKRTEAQKKTWVEGAHPYGEQIWSLIQAIQAAYANRYNFDLIRRRLSISHRSADGSHRITLSFERRPAIRRNGTQEECRG